MDGVPQVMVSKDLLDGEGLDVVSFLADNKIFPSKGEARKMTQNGGVSINKEKVTTVDFRLTNNLLLNDRYLLIQKGKSSYTLAIFQ